MSADPTTREPQWKIIDARTGQRVSVTSFFTEQQALDQIAAWEERAARGGRPDTAHLVGHMVPRFRDAADATL